MTEKELFILPSVMYWLMHQLISHSVCCPPACLPVCLIYQWRPGGRFSSPLRACFIVSVIASFTPFSHTVTFFYQPHFSLLSYAHLQFLSHTRTHTYSIFSSFSSGQCEEEVSASPYGSSSSSSERVGGEFQSDVERGREIICGAVVE